MGATASMTRYNHQCVGHASTTPLQNEKSRYVDSRPRFLHFWVWVDAFLLDILSPCFNHVALMLFPDWGQSPRSGNNQWSQSSRVQRRQRRKRSKNWSKKSKRNLQSRSRSRHGIGMLALRMACLWQRVRERKTETATCTWQNSKSH